MLLSEHTSDPSRSYASWQSRKKTVSQFSDGIVLTFFFSFSFFFVLEKVSQITSATVKNDYR